MKKFILTCLLLLSGCLILLGGCLFVSSDVIQTKKNESSNNNNSILINNRKYDKIVVEGHDYYFRTWASGNSLDKFAVGSDLVHSGNCRKCSIK